MASTATRTHIILALLMISIAGLHWVDAADPEDKIVQKAEENLRSQAAASVIFGVFVLCERSSGVPRAFMRTSKYRLRVIYKYGFCRKQIVAAIRPKSPKSKDHVKAKDHAKVWPFRRQEFKELKSYREFMFLCTTGRVMAQVLKRKKWTTICSCDKHFDAHVVAFTMTKKNIAAA